MNSEVAQQNGSDNHEEVPLYAEAFPALAPVNRSGSPTAIANEWVNPKVQRLKSSVVTQLFQIPMEERAFKHTENFGQSQQDQNKACLDIMQKTGAHIEMSTCKDGSLSLLVSGQLDAVLRARRDIFNRLQTQARVTLDIPKEHHRVILGKGGSKLQKLELDTATKINVPRQEDTSRTITIIGTQDGISRARHEIQLISEEQSKLAIEKLNVEKEFHPFISGPRNQLSQKIEQENGVRVHIPPPSVRKNEIVVTGDKDGVTKAVKIIKEIHQRKKSRCTIINIEVNKTQHKYVIGQRGSTLQDILAAAEVSVEVPPSDSPSETITLRGEPDKLGQALTLVYAKANSVVLREVKAEAWLHKFIIGKKGANINSLTQNLKKVNIEFQAEENKIVVEGPPEEADEAQANLQKQVDDLKRQMNFAEVNVDPKYHKNIIGKGGQNINNLREKYKVNIRIPPDTEKNPTIRIEGDPEGVKETRKILIEISQRMENERSKDILIEHRFHKNIIGAGGDNIRDIRKQFEDVIISFPEPSSKSDVVNLRGPKQNVDSCFKYLKKMHEDMVAKNYSIQVPIFKQFHKNIIGKGGANIRKIREETNTQIELPTENSENEVIKITGRKEDCEKARKMIRDIEKQMIDIVEESITVSQKLHNSMIGTKGKFVRSIMNECGGVHIHFPTEGSGSDQVVIRGRKEDVARAKKELLDLAHSRELTSFTIDIKCKPEFHRFLIGRNGATIRKVRDETGARIIFPQQGDAEKDTISIVGREDEVKKAEGKIKDLIKDLENIIETTINVPQKYHKHFVARRGAVLRDLSDEYGGVTVSFPRQGQDSEAVKIKGAKDCVAGAQKRIEEIVNDLENQVTIECIIPEKFHRTVIGTKGAKVQSITSQFDVQVKFPDRGPGNGPRNEQEPSGEQEQQEKEEEKRPDLILITGNKDKCEAAKQALLALVPISEDVEVPFKFHRYIIGQKGAEVRRMMEEYDVNISIPQADQASDFITITGVAEKLGAAKEGMKEKVKELEKEEEDRLLRSFVLEVEVNAHFHPTIIGRRGVVVTEIRKKYDVNIQFPDRGDENQNLIKIIGYEKNTEDARKHIVGMVSELESHVSQDVHIDRRVHPRLIGAKGRAIKKIMDEYKVDIRFPQNQDLITVTGTQERVDECIEHILNLEEEYMQDIVEREENSRYTRSSGPSSNRGNQSNQQPFVVRGAPWQQVDTNSMDDFPSLGAATTQDSNRGGGSAWGRKH
ncbi:vigilin-like [Styela clava]|uniref:vigilin-like n=1 Tax=Styela clava TaxID=7725 RepID=UPI0019395D02|nr:vigilin-like [Styela clava]